jgi:hypothetical protein
MFIEEYFWFLGNTTVRNPYRLKEGLKKLINSKFNGNLDSIKLEKEFARYLNERGVVNSEKARDETADISDMGRKWRSALMQLGFITPKRFYGLEPEIKQRVINELDYHQSYEVTKAGRKLVETTTVHAFHDQFLRTIYTYQYPNIIERNREEIDSCSPLRIILKLLFGLEERNLEAYLSFNEIWGIVGHIYTEDYVENRGIDQIIAFRNHLKENGRNRKTVKDYIKSFVPSINETRLSTYRDYTDLNIRYLKATGLFVSRKRGIKINPPKYELAKNLLADDYKPKKGFRYLNLLWNGSALPSDNPENARRIIESITTKLEECGVEVLIPSLDKLEINDLLNLRFELEEEYNEQREKEFADKQAENWEDIVEHLKELAGINKLNKVNKDEKPAFFEWSVWRAFLAINNLKNEPWNSRRFKIDQDILPVGVAPSGGPDLIFEFEDFVVVVEVTLLTSSRQEAAEGEPVRRHIAKIADNFDEYEKEVFGLFIAKEINSNTAETFRIGRWYRSDDSSMNLRIIPLTIQQFIDFFEYFFVNQLERPDELRKLFVECLAYSNDQAPQWKNNINLALKRYTKKLP